jgi:hypothetical protein
MFPGPSRPVTALRLPDAQALARGVAIVSSRVRHHVGHVALRWYQPAVASLSPPLGWLDVVVAPYFLRLELLRR